MRRRHRLIRRFLVLLAPLVLIAGCGEDSPTAPSVGLSVPFSTTVVGGEGTGPEAMDGDMLTVEYTGWLYDPDAPDNKGTQFDSNVGGQPFDVTLGAGMVIAGWEQGLRGARVGETRRIVIPPELGYGAAGQGQIPGNATLLFEVTILSIS